jgi:hypothetical protein
MSEEDEIWGDEHQPAGGEEQYEAMLVDVEDHSNSYSSDVIFASSDAEAKTKACEWASEECETIGIERALLMLTGGGIAGSYSAVIDTSERDQ